MAHRSYNGAHQRIRKALIGRLTADLAEGKPGWPCPRCGEPMQPWQPLDCGHSTPQRKAAGLPGDRLEHAGCNRSEKDGPVILTPSGVTPSRDW